jgi:hypothetical protein
MFDADIFVDWSAANGLKPAKPSTDAVWVGELVTQTGFQQETYHRSRFDSTGHVKNALLNQVKEGHRVLVGFDFRYGYPLGFAKALALPHGPQSWW